MLRWLPPIGAGTAPEDHVAADITTTTTITTMADVAADMVDVAADHVVDAEHMVDADHVVAADLVGTVAVVLAVLTTVMADIITIMPDRLLHLCLIGPEPVLPQPLPIAPSEAAGPAGCPTSLR